MGKNYWRRIVHLMGLCLLFVYLIVRVAASRSPEEEKRGTELMAQYSMAQNGVHVRDFQYTFYKLLKTPAVSPVPSVAAGSVDFGIEVGPFLKEAIAERERKRIGALGFLVSKRKLSNTRWILKIGRFSSKKLAEQEARRLSEQITTLPKPLRIKPV